MKRGVLLASFGLMLLLTVRGLSGPVTSGKPQQDALDPFRSKTYVQAFKGKERACVIVIGSGATYMGLYVYDAHGNCIAKDDRGNYSTRDDLAVEWLPPADGTYSVEVRNLGRLRNEFVIVLR